MMPADAVTDHDPLGDYVLEHAERALDALTRLSDAERDGLASELTIEAVHGTRTSLRRLRATLRTFPLSFEDTLLAPVTAEHDLRLAARALSEVRDLDVLREHLLEEIETLPAAHADGPFREELLAALDARRRSAADHVGARRLRPGWDRSVRQLEAWREDPPRLVERQIPALLDAVRDEVRGRLAAADTDPDALHSARKAAKRWRYAAELLLPVAPGAAAHHEAATRIHVRLGLMQDSVVAVGFLRELAGDEGLEAGSRDAARELLRRAESRIDEIVAEAPLLM